MSANFRWRGTTHRLPATPIRNKVHHDPQPNMLGLFLTELVVIVLISTGHNVLFGAYTSAWCAVSKPMNIFA